MFFGEIELMVSWKTSLGLCKCRVGEALVFAVYHIL